MADETERSCLRPGCREKFKGDQCPKCKHVRSSPCTACGYFRVEAVDGAEDLVRCPDCKEVFQERLEPGQRRELAAWKDIPDPVRETVPIHRQKARGLKDSELVRAKKKA